ncbi:MAG: CPBP family glutamic-type intramembrane protease [Phycisphaerales bacterium]
MARRQSKSAVLSPLEAYPAQARRALHILLFVGPLVVIYELALLALLPRHPDLLPNLAHETLLRFFATFGVAGQVLPGIVLLVVLVLWQFLSGESWRPRWAVPALMVVESLLAAMPLLIFGQLVGRVIPAALAAVPMAPSGAAGGLDARIGALDLAEKLVISLGAGLYEELVFRMLLIAVIHTVLVDIGRASHLVGSAVAIAVSAAVFTWYHPLAGPGGAVSMQRVVFFAVAGLWFGVLFVFRGFGIAVGAHVAYDAIVAMWLLGG